MEDDEYYEPDSSGQLELRYRGWTALEPRVWTFAHCLLRLDISFNQLHTLPAEISSLQFLEELNCSCNKLTSIPESIASLAFLRVIKANGNSLVFLPKEVGACKALETLNLSENLLTSIPQEIAGCTRLQTLLLQNNHLPRLPLSLATLNCKIQQLDISNNSEELTTTMPVEIHRDVHSILWILSLQHEKRHCLDRLKQDVKLMQHDNIATERELAQAKERIASLEERRMVLEDDMDSVKYYLIARFHCREMMKRMLEWWQEGKRAWASRAER